ncbi:hypothetical protein CULT_330021 [[Clostridium] ultunense Esp]|uniref:Uncharacterized protein n=1 Tax=[Clostridium] ultunense Esp TaxID=1288971 RepID=M1ZBS6_9FIRM|nr:hypothetical protein [Schnuerera ultunensis]CCQ95936.1 hypothetical protein CULT_330021 [[Clostridium] ultunense Esp]SHD76828.1 conserved protein of unknown function [[Clostridium] ultunense Esp]
MDKKFQRRIFILILIALTISLGGYILQKQNNKTKENQNRLLNKISSLENELDKIKEENSILNKRVNELQDEVYRDKDLLQEQVQIINFRNEKSFTDENLILPIFTANINTYKKEIKYYVTIPKILPMEEQLHLLVNKLSQYCFNGLPIEIVDIKDIEGKKIAIINLKEYSINQGIEDLEKLIGSSWKAYYFQGTAGGIITSYQLIDTLLQKDYDGEWIDGVQFLYEGKDIVFEHVLGLSDIHYR